MKRFLIGAVFAFYSLTTLALQPYLTADKVAAGDLKAALAAVEQKLTAEGFAVVGRHMPKGVPDHGVVVLTDAGLTEALKQLGGTAVIGIPIRVGVKADGSVSYVNLEYWERAYIRKDYGKIEAAAKAAAARLEKALGAGKPFGGEVEAGKLAHYHYMFGMEYFEDHSELRTYKSFDEAVKVVRDNLAAGPHNSAKVYELVYPDRKLAVFGVAHNDPEKGEGWWVNKIGPDHIAALPWEIFISDGTVYSLRGRFRTALSWPALTMGQFMTISQHPDFTKEVMEDLAGVL